MKRLDINSVLRAEQDEEVKFGYGKRSANRSIKPKVNECANGKLTYDSMAEASAMANIMKNKRHRGLSPYKCNICGKYHLGRRKK